MERSSARGSKSNAVTEEQKEYAAFEDKVKRTVYLDNLTPLVTVSVLKMALGQFGVVVDAQILPNYLEPKNTGVSALVEMQNERQAANTVTEIAVNAFMIAGAPRPVRAMLAEPEMFPDRPAFPGRRIQCYWIDTNDPDWEIASQLRQLARKHAAEASYLLKMGMVYMHPSLEVHGPSFNSPLLETSSLEHSIPCKDYFALAEVSKRRRRKVGRETGGES